MFSFFLNRSVVMPAYYLFPMKKYICFLLLVIISHYAFSQTQIGSDIIGEDQGNLSGSAIVLSENGGHLIIGAPQNNNGKGHARVYFLTGGTWVQKGADLDESEPGAQYGASVAMSAGGDKIAIGAIHGDGGGMSNSGRVRAFELSGNSWVQVGSDIDGEAAHDFSSASISMSEDGNRIAIGAPLNDGGGDSSGHVRVFERVGSSWQQLGVDIEGEAAKDQSGQSVSLSADGSRIAIGAIGNDPTASLSNAGHVRVYEYSGGTWMQIGLDINGEATGDEFGGSVSLSEDGNTLAVGGRLNDGAEVRAGHVRVYEYTGSNWIQIGNDIDGQAFDERFGTSVSIADDGGRVVIGAPHSQAARTYEFFNGEWLQLGNDMINGDDEFGLAVSMSSDGTKAAVADPYYDHIGFNEGLVKVYENSTVLNIPPLDTVHLTNIEYFFDTDPGIGLATPLPITPTEAIDTTVVLDIDTLSTGLHTFYARIKDDNGFWSFTQKHLFFKIAGNGTNPSLTEIEYFFDADPGLGNGYPVAFTPGQEANVPLNISIDTLATGLHTIYFRTKADNGYWSFTQQHTFFKINGNGLTSTLTEMEYFFDTDPGLGMATNIPVANLSEVDTSFTVNIDTLVTGLHTLYVRSLSDNGFWSFTQQHTFFKINGSGLSPTITAMEYFFDDDPGFGNATTLGITAAGTIDTSFTVDLTGLPTGIHTLYVRSLSDNGFWSFTQQHTFFVTQGLGGTKEIVALEYYWDIDPGYGNGFPVDLSGEPMPIYTLDKAFVVSMSGLTEGLHTLNLRAKDDAGDWSFIYTQEVENDTTDGLFPEIILSRDSFYYTSSDCSNVGVDTFQVFNPGGNQLNFVFSENLSWINIDPVNNGLPAGDTAVLNITYNPTGLPAGSYSGMAEIATNDPNTPLDTLHFEIELLGQPLLTASVDTLDFGVLPVGDSLTHSFMFTNLGCDTSFVDSIILAASPFSFLVVTDSVLLLNEAAVFSVQFLPQADSVYDEMLLVYHDGEVDTVVLIGAGVTIPEIHLSTNNLDFTTANCGDSTQLNFTIENMGDGTLNWSLGNLPLPGWLQIAPSSGEVLPSQSTNVLVDIHTAGLSEGSYGYSISIPSNDPDLPVATIALSLTVNGLPDLTVSTDTLLFASVPIGQTDNKVFNIMNEGCAPLLIDSAEFTGTDFSFVGVPLPFNIVPFGSGSLSVQFSPSTHAAMEDTLTLYTNDGVYTIHLSAIGCPDDLIITQNDTTLCVGDSILLDASLSEFLTWSTGDTTASIYAKTDGFYSVAYNDTIGCNLTSNTVHVDINPISFSSASSLVSCYGFDDGTVNLTASGGNPPFLYAWSNGDATEDIDSLLAGTYTVTVTDDKGCTDSLSESVIQPDSLVLSVVSQMDEACSGDETGSFILSATGGSLTYSYNIGGSLQNSPVFNGLTAGNYTATLIDWLGCTADTTVVISSIKNSPVMDFSGNLNFDTSLVNPLVGSPFSTFQFEASYSHPDGVLPAFQFPRIQLNGPNNLTLVMQEVDPADTGVTDGKLYTASTGGLQASSSWQMTAVADAANGCAAELGSFTYPDVLNAVDVSIFADDISFSNLTPDPLDSIDVYAQIHNESDFEANNFVARLINQYDGTIYPDITIAALAQGASATVTWRIETPADPAFVPMEVVIDYTDVLIEPNELDNQAIRPFINGAFNTSTIIEVTAAVSPLCVESSIYASVNVSGQAFYSGLAVPLPDSSVTGAQVDLSIIETGATFQTTTNSVGYFSINMPADTALGNYHVIGTVTDFTIIGDLPSPLVFKVYRDPVNVCETDLVSNISFPNSVFVGDSLSGTVTVTNVGETETTAPTILDVNIPGGTPAIGTFNIPALDVGQSFTQAINDIQFNTVGTTYAWSNADSNDDEAECRENNNTDSETIHVLPILPDVAVGVTYFPSNLYDCKTYSFPFKVYNHGGTATGAFDVEVITYRNNMEVERDTFYVIDIAPFSQQTISFSKSFGQSGSYQFVYNADIPLASGGMVHPEVSNVNNSTQRTFSVGECYVDLYVSGSCTSFDIEPVDPTEAGTITLSAYIGNGGNKDVTGDIAIDFIVDGTTVSTTHTGGLNAGQSAQITINATVPTHGNIEFMVKVDPADVVEESSEGNNEIIQPLCWDFELSGRCYVTEFWEKSQLANTPVSLTVGFKNTGFYKASSVDVLFEINGPGLPVGWNDVGTSIIGPIEKSCSCPWSIGLATPVIFPETGTYQVRMTADPNDGYTECDETDNQMVVDVTVVSLPDFRTLSPYIASSLLNPKIDTAITLNITYENVGHVELDSMELKVFVDDVPLDSLRVGGLPTNTFASVAIPTPWFSNIVGGHVIRTIIDSDDEITEGNELNNEATRLVFVGDGANLYFTHFEPDNTSPAVGDTIQIIADISNEGDLTAVAQWQLFYISNLGDTILVGEKQITVIPDDTITIQIAWPVELTNTVLIGKIIEAEPFEYDETDNMAIYEMNAMDLSLLGVDASCDGQSDGTATVVASGGLPNYFYLWENGQTTAIATDLLAGVYTVSVSDASGRIVVDSVEVGGSDIELPTAACKDTIISIPASGMVNILVDNIDNGSTDNCGIADRTISMSSFDCNDLGAHIVNMVVTDSIGLKDSCEAMVTIADTIFPIVTCNSATLNLDENGTAILSKMDAGEATDNCSATDSLSQTIFDCSDVGIDSVAFFATDPSGNMSSCMVGITVQDTLAPTAFCKNSSLSMDANGIATINPADINMGSTDNCNIASMSVYPNSLTCGNIGSNLAMLTVTDDSGHSSTCLSIVTLSNVLIWIGGDGLWNEPTNWDLGYVPTVCHSVIIPTGKAELLSNEHGFAKTLETGPDAELVMPETAELTVKW